MKNYKSLALALALTGTLLTGCGNQSNDTDEKDTKNETTTTESTDTNETVDDSETEDTKDESADDKDDETKYSESTDDEDKDDDNNEDSESSDEIKGVSKENNMVVDEENKTVTIYATFNGKFLTESTRHLVVSESGKFGDKPVFISYTDPADFHQALLDIGAEAGDNMTPDNAEETTSEGTPLDVTIYWDGNEEGKDVNDIVKDSNGKDLDLRFTGNLDRSNEMKTGCLSCLDSCTVGIVSNANYPFGAVEKTKEVEFSVDEDNAPEADTPVAIVYTIKE